jgi:hypothetical protein
VVLVFFHLRHPKKLKRFVCDLHFYNFSQACTAMNGTQVEGGGDPSRKLFVGRAQKKVERLAELRRLYENVKNERLQRFQGANLFVKNIEESIDEEQLTTAFNKFGPINSVKVRVVSFVCQFFPLLFTGDARRIESLEGFRFCLFHGSGTCNKGVDRNEQYDVEWQTVVCGVGATKGRS